MPDQGSTSQGSTGQGSTHQGSSEPGRSRPFPVGVKLGVDVGEARVGLAACDRDGLIATPVRTLKRDHRKNHDVRLLVREAIERDAVQIVIGLPKNLSGLEGSSAEMARSYAGLVVAELLRRSRSIPVRLVDERLSTVSAHRSLHAAGLGSREHRKVVDQVAAVEILQHAIDMQRSRGRDVGDPVPVPEVAGVEYPPQEPTQEPVMKDISASREDAES